MPETVQDARSLWDAARTILLTNPALTPLELSYVHDIEPDTVFGSRAILTVSTDGVRVGIENNIDEPLTAALSQAARRPMSYLISLRRPARAATTVFPPDQQRQPAPRRRAAKRQPLLQTPAAARRGLASFNAAFETPLPSGTARQPALDIPPTQVRVSAAGARLTNPYEPAARPVADADGRDSEEKRARGRNVHPRDEETHLNPDDNFENFVTGPATNLANAAAQAVAEQPGEVYNPLFIYGGSGLGKTHLLNAIGNEVRVNDVAKRVYYTTAEEFTNDYINAVHPTGNDTEHAQEFNRKYRSYDVLLVDDIQFLGMGNRVETQEAFFNTFNALQRMRKQIVIASDVAPRLLQGLQERLVTRFDAGLSVDVQPPEKETRIAILRMKIASFKTKVVIPPEVIDLIADQVTNSVRELEGALNRVMAMATLNRQPVTTQLAQQTLQDYFVQNVDVTPADIITQTAAYFQLSFDDIVSSRRQKKIAMARQIAMYICREMTGLSLTNIGEIFGGRDHTTVIHAYQKISTEMTEKREVYNYVNELTNKLKQKK